MEIRYIPDDEFQAFIESKNKWEIIATEGRFRIKVTELDGTEYVVRPASTRA